MADGGEMRRLAALVCVRAGLVGAVVLGIGAVLCLGASPYIAEPGAAVKLAGILAAMAVASWAAGWLLGRLLRPS